MSPAARDLHALDLFERILEMSPSQRDNFLEQECAGDPDLRVAVERLIASDTQAEAEDFLGGDLATDIWGRRSGESVEPGPPYGLDDNQPQSDRAEEDGPGIGDAPGPEPVQVGQFVLGEKLGSGTFGTVWKARHLGLDHDIALKIARPGLMDGDRFLREARAVAQLRHPGIVAVHDVGTQDGLSYIVSDLVDGVDLARWLKENYPTWRQTAAWVADAAEALQAAHDRGVIHRDVKPSNLLVDADGRILVTDFGVAKRESGEVTMTLDGDLIGTPAYMAPEQIDGAHHVDARADVYALGVVLYELLTGERPFRGIMRMLLEQVKHDNPRAPRTLNDRIPRDLETICLKAMDKEPSRRYGKAVELSADLRRWLNGETIKARPASRLERAWRWTRRHPSMAALGVVGVVAFLAITATVFFVVYTTRLASANTELEGARRLADSYLYALRISQSDVAWRDNQFERSSSLLDECLPEMRGWEWHYLDRQRNSRMLEIRAREGIIRSVAFSRDGRRIATAGDDGKITIWDVANGTFLFRVQGSGTSVSDPIFSPDGRCLLSVASDWTIEAWDADNGQNHVKVEHKERWDADNGQNLVKVPIHRAAFSPDSQRVACVPSVAGQGAAAGQQASRGSDTIRIWDANGGQDRLTLRKHGERFSSVAFSPDGRHVVATGYSMINVWDTASGRELPELRGRGDGFLSVTFSPDGHHVAAAGSDATVTVWDFVGRRELLTLTGLIAAADSVAFSPDGRRIATASLDRTVKVWDIGGGQERLTLRGHGENIQSIAFSPDGRHLAAAGDKSVTVWDATGGQAFLPLRRDQSYLSVAFSPDDLRLASGTVNSTIEVWDVASGRDLFTVEHSSMVQIVAFSPDGHRIVGASRDGTVTDWDTATEQELHTLRGHIQDVMSAALSPDGQRIASAGSDGNVEVWDAIGGQHAFTFRAQTEESDCRVAFSPDGQHIAVAGDHGTIKVWDIASRQEQHAFRGPESRVSSLALSPDGQRIAVAGSDTTIKVWDAVRGQELLTLRGHTESVNSIVFSPDGHRIVSGGKDRMIKVWDAVRGQELLTLRGHHGMISSVAFSHDGWRIASAGGDRTIQLWDATPIKSETLTKRIALADARWDVWQRHEAAECLKQKLWFSAAWHLDQLLKRHPDEVDLKSKFAAARAKIGEEN